MRDSAPMREPTAPVEGTEPGPDSAAAAIAVVLAASPAAQALFDEAGRCAAASPEFSRRAAAEADATGRLSPNLLAAADVRSVMLDGRPYRLVTLPAAPPPERGTADMIEPVLRALLDAIPAAINAKNREGRYTFMNRYQSALWGIAPADAIGRTVFDIRGPEAQQGVDLERRVLETGEPVPFFDETRRGTDGTVRNWLVTKLPLKHPESGETVGVATFALDISDRKRLEATLIETRKVAEDASQAKTLFLAQVSHELRTPLNAIIGFTEMMTQEIFGPLGARQYHGYADDVLKAARHLLGVITDMLDLAKLDAAAMALELRSIAPGEILADAGRIVAPLAAGKRVTLRKHVEPGLPLLKADARRLCQALINLLTNAIKFTPDGGTVLFGAVRGAEGGMEIFVEDSGVGMSEKDIEIALLVFGRVQEGYAKAQEGTGIGLPLAKALIELHGGCFTIDSAPGSGTKIRALFPQDRLVIESEPA